MRTATFPDRGRLNEKVVGRFAGFGATLTALNGFSASFLVLGLAWMTTGTEAQLAFLGPMMVFALPAALWQLIRHRRPARAGRVLLAWAAAAIPALAIACPWL